MRDEAKAAAAAALGLAPLLLAGLAQAAAIERAVPMTVRLLFEEGTYGELGVAYGNPHQSGENATIAPGVTVTGNTGDLFEDYWNYSAAWKSDITEKLSYALVFDQPYGAATSYGRGSFAYPGFSYDGTSADLDTYQFTGILAYDIRPDVKIYGGLRAERLDADASIPFIGPSAGYPPYTAETDKDWAWGYLLGAAYSRPEIALRVALTYYSKIEHTLASTEFGTIHDETDITTPQAVSFEFQTGVAERTLLFGSVRWVDWSEFTIAPPAYTQVVGMPLVDYTDDWTTYTIGVGRQFTDKFAGSVALIYEPSQGGSLTTLGPYDGRTLGAAALSYDIERINITGGVTYGRLGDTSNVLDTTYDDGSVWGAGLRIGYSF